jgi:hypothetical protein
MNYLTSTIKDDRIINIHPDSFFCYLHLATKDVTGCDAVPRGCSMEFLKNNKTMETLRQFNDSCYHKTADVCKGDECSCSSDCKNFTFKYNTTENRTGDIFSCQMKITVEGIWMNI